MSKSTGCRNEPSTSENDTMMRTLFLFAALTLALTAGSCCGEPKTELFNGRDLTGWVCVTDPESGADVRETFSVRDGSIRIAGHPFGYMRTEEAYGDYRLHVEWRWVGEATNSGIFQRVQAGDRLWPEAVECQLQAGRAGVAERVYGPSLPGAYRASERGRSRGVPQHLADRTPVKNRDLGGGRTVLQIGRNSAPG